MSVKAIAKNIRRRGVVETYRIYRRNKLLRECRRLLLGDDGSGIGNVKEKDLQERVITQLIPSLYRDLSQYPVTHSVVLMERGPRLSASLSYLKKYLEENTDYEVIVHRLSVRAVSNREYYYNSLRYIADCARAEAIFNCTANDLMGYLTLRNETTYIQLWHGCGIMKKVGLSTIGHSFGKTAAGHEKYPLNTNYTYVTLASPEQEWIYEEAMGLDASTGVLVSTGISRTDVFFDSEYLLRAREALCEAVAPAQNKKIILYAPTFRGEVAQAQGPNALDLRKMAQALGNDYVLVVKHHQSVKVTPEIPEDLRDSFVFDVTRGKGVSINQLLATADICISDYSSIVFEYSLFEKPMAFFTYDIDEYIDERGLYYKLDELLPGPLLSSTDEIIDFVQNVDSRFDRRLVHEFKERFMRNCDGHSTERIVALIGTKPQLRGQVK